MTRIEMIVHTYDRGFCLEPHDPMILRKAHDLDSALGKDFAVLIVQWQDGYMTASEMIKKMIVVATAEV